MKIKSQIMTQASGSVHGLTASRNRGGMYFRARAVPVNPGTPQQSEVRNQVKAVTSAWANTLTQDQRDAWNLYAVNTPVTDVLGNSILLTGINMLVRCNVPRLQAGLPTVYDGPTTFGLPTFTPVSLAVSISTQQVAVTFDTGDEWANEDEAAMLVYISRPYGQGINYFKGPYQLGGAIDGDSGTPPTSPALIATPFPFVATDKLFIRVTVSRADGRLSSDQRLSIIAA